MMEQTVRIRKVHDNGTATVIHTRQSACSGDCHKCSGCGAAQEVLLFEARNPIGAAEGDRVVVRSDSGPVMKAVGVLYALPLLLFFLGYWAFDALLGLGALGGCAAFAAGIAAAVVYDRKVASKKKTIYTITGFAG
jgi:sigma-E factor negative regulatory protein RseC